MKIFPSWSVIIHCRGLMYSPLTEWTSKSSSLCSTSGLPSGNNNISQWSIEMKKLFYDATIVYDVSENRQAEFIVNVDIRTDCRSYWWHSPEFCHSSFYHILSVRLRVKSRRIYSVNLYSVIYIIQTTYAKKVGYHSSIKAEFSLN